MTTTKMMNQSTLKTLNLKIGPYTVYPIPTGLFGLDGGAMFGTVPKVLWNKNHPTDEANRIQIEARALVLVSDSHKILIDTGNGSDFVAKYGDKIGSKFAQMYAINPDGPSLEKSLHAVGLSVDDITDVILTHLHFDHAGGATKANANNEIVATFPKAKYYVQMSNYKTAITPNKRERASYLKPNFEPLVKHNQLQFLNGSEENLLPHISFFISNGHTHGHQSVIIEDDSQRLVYCGDVIPTASHVRSAWVMGYDLEPLTIMSEKESLLKLSHQKSTYYFFEHDPYCDIAVVEPKDGDYAVKERFWLETP